MEPSRFDDLTKALATATSRRQALKAIGAALGGALGLSRIGTAFAKCQNAGHACGSNKQCCSKLCCNGKCCDSGQTCSNGTCVAPTTTTTPAPTTSTTTAPPCPGGTTCLSNSDCCSGVCCPPNPSGGLIGTCCATGQTCNTVNDTCM
jgi:hypothetical protein